MYDQGWAENRKNKKAELWDFVKTVTMFIIGGSILIAVSAELALIIVG